MLKRLFAVLLAVALAADGATVVSDTLYTAAGKLATGTISLQPVTVSESGVSLVSGATITITLTAGVMYIGGSSTISLAAGTYNATYSMPGGKKCVWTVPSSGPVTVRSMENCPASSTAPTSLAYANITGLTAGDLLYAGAAGVVTRLPKGTNGHVLTQGATYPGWAAATGGVTSVGGSFTGGLISVSGSPVTSSGTLAYTVAGTSGGIPYFSGASTWASSAALTANAVVIGGGAGATPATISAATTTTHALFATAGAPAFRAIDAGDIASGVIAIARLATGTPDGTKFIRDDGALATVSTTGTVRFPFQTVCQGGVAGTSLNLPNTAAPSPTGCSGTNQTGVVQFPIGFTTYNAWVKIKLPVGYTTGSTVTWYLDSRSADSSNNAVLTPSWAKVTAGGDLDAPSYTSLSTVNIVGVASSGLVRTTGTFAPTAAAAGDWLYFKMLMNTSALTSGFDLVGLTLTLTATL